MTKILYFILFLMSGLSWSDSVILDIGSNHLFSLTYNDTGTHQTGLTVALSIKRVSDGYWYDFMSSTFKASAWSSKTVTLTEDVTNHTYYYKWIAQGGDTIKNQYVFHAECTGQFVEEETVCYEDLSTSIAAIKTKVDAINP